MIQIIPTKQATTILVKHKSNSEEDYFHYQSNVSNDMFRNKKIEFSNCKNQIQKAFLKSHLPKSPMPKHMSSASYNNLTDLASESEEEEENDEDYDDDSDDEEDEDYESNTDILSIPEEEQNMLRTESTISLAKVNPLLFSISDYPHKAPKTENFKIGSMEKDSAENIKHSHLPRTPFPKTLNNSYLEASNITDKKEEISLDLKKSSMLARRRTSSTNQSPVKSILKTENKMSEDL